MASGLYLFYSSQPSHTIIALDHFFFIYNTENPIPRYHDPLPLNISRPRPSLLSLSAQQPTPPNPPLFSFSSQTPKPHLHFFSFFFPHQFHHLTKIHSTSPRSIFLLTKIYFPPH
ncbi:hypothetical protein RchiOBHm_Chr4g0425681 [Rosa chinensis]|uniref:Uncharacterized protein n=1 Tax=Rosa chinensis TaxID=74649 RepID=A0A2P6QZ76_ROSCH|nr:hypothetical protein RchiOBHm_Chr4g0425681 [Rosa chinensis]